MTGATPVKSLGYTTEYSVYKHMLKRCHNPKARDFPRYGGRGVTVCADWRNGRGAWTGFLLFLNEVGRRPSPKHSIDRIDNSRGYEPGNVRWATLVEQANNKRTSRFVTYRGSQMTVADAVRAAGSLVTRETAVCRLNSGWDPQAAVETPPLFKREPGTRKVIREVANV